jgi:hypothetical protein
MMICGCLSSFKLRMEVRSMNKIYLQNGMEAFEAVYNESVLKEYNDNPYIQALPALGDSKTIISSLMLNPDFNVTDREMDSTLRLHILHRLYSFFQPLPKHVQIYNMISTLIRQGYIARNPFDKDYKQYINKTGKEIINRSYEINSRKNFRTTASCGLIIGYSGMGKTSSVNRVLSNIPQIIIHNKYNGNNFNQIQLSWLKLEAPHNSSLKALSLQYFMKIDELLGGSNFKKYVSRNLSVDAMLPLMGQLAQNVGLGLLVIDELQHLQNKGMEQMMNYFVTLINSFGVPILLIGTPASYNILESEFRIARRVTGNSEIIWNNMDNNEEFKLFMQGMWKYQYVRKPIPLTTELINEYYEHTQGISDLIIKLFINSQYKAITTGKEEITIDIIRKAAKEQFQIMQPMLDAIKSKNSFKMSRFQDIKRIDFDLNNQVKKVEVKTNNNIQQKPTEKKTNIVVKTEVISNNHKATKRLDDNDLRKLVGEGKKNNISPHDVLLKNDYIDDMSLWKDGDIK